MFEWRLLILDCKKNFNYLETLKISVPLIKLGFKSKNTGILIDNQEKEKKISHCAVVGPPDVPKRSKKFGGKSASRIELCMPLKFSFPRSTTF